MVISPSTSALQGLLVGAIALRSALAVSLNDFTPRASNLPSSCNSVYMAQINGCSPSDFQSQCSSGCISALNNLQGSVSSACKGVTGDNILVAFINGQGTGDLCKNAQTPQPSTSTQSSSTQAPPSTTSSSSAAPSTTESSSAAAPSTTSSTSSSSTPSQTQAQTTSSSTTSASTSTPSTTGPHTILSTATVIPSAASSTDGTSSGLMFATSLASGVSSVAAPTAASSASTASINPQETAGGSGSLFSYAGPSSEGSGVAISLAGLMATSVLVALCAMI